MVKRRSLKQKMAKGLPVGLAVAVCAAAGLPVPAKGQSINCIRALSFGTVASCAGTGTVTVTPAGSISSTGCVTTSGGAHSQGQCLITGSFFPVRPIQASVTSASYTISNGSATMSVTGIDVEAVGNGLQTTQTTFQFVLDVGGVLNVGNNQASGTYTGNFTVIANLL